MRSLSVAPSKHHAIKCPMVHVSINHTTSVILNFISAVHRPHLVAVATATIGSVHASSASSLRNYGVRTEYQRFWEGKASEGKKLTFSPGFLRMVPLSFFIAPAILSPIVVLRFWWCTLRRPKRPWRRVVVVRVVRVVVWWVILADFVG